MIEIGKENICQPIGGKGRQKKKSGVKKTIKHLDLSFEGQPCPHTSHDANAPLNNGFRPHGGYRGRHDSGKQTGTKHFPPSLALISLTDEPFDLDVHEARPSSPSWAVDVSQESNCSGESPLYIHKLLSPSRLSSSADGTSGPQSTANSNKSGRSGGQYYRPNRTHLYLTTTGPKVCPANEINMSLGRPTRTMLLRARYKNNSTSVNTNRARKELIKKIELRSEAYKPVTPSYKIKDVPEGESVYSYLTGARYNRARVLDARSVQTHGVYLPRSDPTKCFTLPRKAEHEPTNTDGATVDEESEVIVPPTPTTSTPTVSTPTVSTPTMFPPTALVAPTATKSRPTPAWSDLTQLDINITPVSINSRFHRDVTKEVEPGDVTVGGMASDTLGVFTKRQSGEFTQQKTEEDMSKRTRPGSACSPQHYLSRSTPTRPKSACVLPTVQGRALTALVPSDQELTNQEAGVPLKAEVQETGHDEEDNDKSETTGTFHLIPEAKPEEGESTLEEIGANEAEPSVEEIGLDEEEVQSTEKLEPEAWAENDRRKDTIKVEIPQEKDVIFFVTEDAQEPPKDTETASADNAAQQL